MIDDVSLTAAGVSLPLQPGFGLLRVDIGSALGDGALGGRVTITAADTQTYTPADSCEFQDGSFHVEGRPFEVALPEGPAELTIARGFEYDVWSEVVDILPGRVTHSAPRLIHCFPMSTDGWYGDDSHVHLFFHRSSRHSHPTPRGRSTKNLR